MGAERENVSASILRHDLLSLCCYFKGVSFIYEWPVSSVYRIDRKKDKAERKILDSQERAFWDVHRPVVS